MEPFIALSFVVTCKDKTAPTPPEADLGDVIGSGNLYDDGTNSVDNSGMNMMTLRWVLEFSQI